MTSGLKDKHTDKVSYDTSLTEEGSPGPVLPDSQPTAVGIPGRLCPPPNQIGVLQQQQTNPATARRSTGAADNRQPVGTLFSFDTWIGTPPHHPAVSTSKGFHHNKDMTGALLLHRLEMCFLHREASLDTSRDQ